MCSAAERNPREPRMRWKRAMYSRLLLAVSPESSCESAATTGSGSRVAWVEMAEFVLSSKQRTSAIHLFTAGAPQLGMARWMLSQTIGTVRCGTDDNY